MDNHYQQNKQALRASCVKRLAHHQALDDEALLMELRAMGCDKIDAIVLLRELRQIGLAAAKIIVHRSNAWADRRAADESFHESLLAALGE